MTDTRHDALAPARGLLNGLILGTLMWLVILWAVLA